MSTYNTSVQNYRGLPLQLSDRDDYRCKKAKEYHIISSKGYFTDYKIWIPNRFLSNDGTINNQMDFMWIFKDAKVYKNVQEAGFKFRY